MPYAQFIGKEVETQRSEGPARLICLACQVTDARAERTTLRGGVRRRHLVRSSLASPKSAVFLFQFCELLSAPEVSRWAGPIIDVLLDYVGNVQLCSRLKEHIDSFEDWAVIKEKAGRAVAAAASIASVPQRLRLQAV